MVHRLLETSKAANREARVLERGARRLHEAAAQLERLAARRQEESTEDFLEACRLLQREDEKAAASARRAIPKEEVAA